jgi:hypothetical protein
METTDARFGGYTPAIAPVLARNARFAIERGPSIHAD